MLIARLKRTLIESSAEVDTELVLDCRQRLSREAIQTQHVYGFEFHHFGGFFEIQQSDLRLQFAARGFGV
jgi:hypothetical protein